MAFINSVDVYGEDVVADALLSRNLNNIGQEFRDDSITTIGDMGLAYLYGGDRGIKIADFPNLTSMGRYALYICQELHTLILRGNVVCAKTDLASLEGSKIVKGTGYIYVPKNLVASYKAATNWGTYAAQFRALEDYTVDGTIWGDLDENKI
jgi:hypothetical protein